MSDYQRLESNFLEIEEKVNEATLESKRQVGDVKIVAATKMIDTTEILKISKLGIYAVAENRVQELLRKYDEGAYDDIPLHFIGNLQTNKVKYIVGKVDVIQSVNSIKLAEEINKYAVRNNLIQKIMIEVNIADEKSKCGMSSSDVDDFLDNISKMSNVSVVGLMAMMPKIGNSDKNSKHFQQIHQLFIDIGQKKYDNINMDFLSVGMSNDFYDAILGGSNMVRIGSALFK